MTQQQTSGELTHRVAPKGASRKVCLGMAYLFTKTFLKRFGFKTESITRFDSMDNYIADRVEQINEYKELFRPYCAFEGNTVLEIGCSRGYLLNAFLQQERFNAIGADVSDEALAQAVADFGDRIAFVRSTPTGLPLEDRSVDVIYTIDTVEHLTRPREIFMEAWRVLRKGGVFLVHFHPWLGPYGSHLEDTIPFPWPHVMFSMNTLLDVAAYLYESPDYDTPCYYVDRKSGGKGPNPFTSKAQWDEFLNHITLSQYKRMLKTLPFEVLHGEQIGFGGKRFRYARYLNKLSQLPLFDELFTKAIFCVLKK
jgi:SAM-dependent methyltransferase